MPRRDGTGPMGCGPRAGRGLGFCLGSNIVNYKSGFDRRASCGYARRFGFCSVLGRNFALNKKFGYMHKRLFQHQFEFVNK